MIPFFVVYLWDTTANEEIYFSRYDGSDTPVVILDDGWSPNITTYVRDGEKTWSDVIEEIECMTNVTTRDEALALIEKLNALIHRAARDIEEKQAYTVTFIVKSQFSTDPDGVRAFVVSPPDDGNVITLSTDIQTAPPGQIRFKLRFRRTGAWVATDGDVLTNFYLYANDNVLRGVWWEATPLSVPVQLPTPVSARLNFLLNTNETCTVENLFACVNTQQVFAAKNFVAPYWFDLTQVIYPSSMHALYDFGYLIKSNAEYNTPDPGPSSTISLQKGNYAVFASWRAVQAYVPHALKIRFSGGEETSYGLLLAKNTSPKLAFLGTVTLHTNSEKVFLLTKIGHSTGFELEKLVFVKLKPESSIIQANGLYTNFTIASNELLVIKNHITEPKKALGIATAATPNEIKTLLYTYDSLDSVVDSQSIYFAVIAHSPQAFSLRVNSTFANIPILNVTLVHRPIRTTIQ